MQMSDRSRRSNRSKLSHAVAMIQPLEPRTLFAVTASTALPAVTIAHSAGVQTINLDSYFTGQGVPANTYDFNTTLGVMPVEFTPNITPLTVANFLSYNASGAYTNTVIHRLDSGFVWQTGEYTFDSSQSDPFVTTPTGAGVQNEFSQSNTIGTIALAKLSGNVNSGTDGFFFNLADNSSNLDSQNGGFTVFGHVAGAGDATPSAGIDVMNAIGSETVIDDSSAAGDDFSTLPVQSSSAGVTASNLLFIKSIAATTSAYSVSSDNPAVATASISGDNLMFTPVATGTANITVSALDTDGNTVSQTFAVTVPDVTKETIGFGSGIKTAVYKDVAGSTVKLTVSGATTSAELDFDGDNVAATSKGSTMTITGDSLSLRLVAMTGTSKHALRVQQTVVRIGVTGKNSAGIVGATIGGFTADNDVDNIIAPDITLDGTTSIDSGLYLITVGGMADGSVLYANALGGMTFDGSTTGTIETNGPINILTAKGAMGGVIDANFINKFTGKNVSTDFNLTSYLGQLKITGTYSGVLAASDIAVATIDTLSNATIALNGADALDLRSMKIRTSTNSTIGVVGNIGALTFTQPITSTNILAGISSTATSVSASDLADFTGSGIIASLKIGGSRKVNGFADSSIGAIELEKVVLGNIVDTASSEPFYGIAAYRIVSLRGYFNSKPLVLEGIANQPLLDARLAAEGIVSTNVKFVIQAPSTT